MSGSKSETKTTTDPALLAMYQANDAKANQVADSIQYSPYSGERVAGFNPTQTGAQQGLIGAANDPTGTNAIKASQAVTGGLLDYHPQTLAGTDLSPYYNPFQKQVIDASVAQNQFARDQQGVADNASATAAHAFGGTRQAVQRANTTAAYDRNDQQNLAQLNSANFDQAQRAAQGDISNGILGANFRLNAADANANMGNAYFADQVGRQGVLAGVGQQQQQQQQSQDDAAYEEFLRQLNTPIIAQQIRNQSLGMIPLQQTQTTTQKGDLFGGILGAIAGGAQIGQKFYGGR